MSHTSGEAPPIQHRRAADSQASTLRFGLRRLKDLEVAHFKFICGRITHSGLREVPYMHDLNPSTYIGMLDFDSNRIAELPAYSIRVKAGTLILNHNSIAAIRGAAFDGSKIAEVDLSETSLTKIPTRGLESLEVLELRDVPALREFPSVYHFRFIRVAHLTYPYHCCAFQFPETHDPEEHSRFQKHCNSDDETIRQRQNRPPVVGEEHDFQLLERFFVVQLNNKHTTTPPTRRFFRHVFSEFGTIHDAPKPGAQNTTSSPWSIFHSRGMEGTFHPEVRPQEEQWAVCTTRHAKSITVKDFSRANDESVLDHLDPSLSSFQGTDPEVLWNKFK
ncbi:hypothetical protein HPB51_017365 [Rhipicephalus microplus]|uniref:Uncharacterized protein n=1 Tax=Rhipicephalus microplus TaxID=6941 RepID=A0A9J6DB56_RHIMP|nr:hypothetical protein HPB51_017365 [Rhipicephalus microplus]